MKLLYVASRWPWPIIVGRQRMIDQFLSLSNEFCETHLAVFTPNQENFNNSPKYLKSVAKLTPATIMDIFYSLITNPFLPLQCHLFNSPKARKQIEDLIKEIKPNYIVFDMIRPFKIAEYIKKKYPSQKIILDADDLLSLRYERLLQNYNYEGIAGTYEERLPPLLKIIAKTFPKLLTRLEAPLMSHAEDISYNLFDKLIFVSANEAEIINKRNNSNKALSLAPLINLSTNEIRDYSKSLRFVFIGNANYVPNAQALFSLNSVAKRLRDEIDPKELDYSFEFAGTQNQKLKLDYIKSVGFVDDLKEFFANDAIMVTPIYTGTGIKTKIIDALEHGVPIISTELGVEGLSLKPDTHYIEFEDEDGLFHILANFIEDAQKRENLLKMGNRANDALLPFYNKDKSIEIMKKILEIS